MGFLGGPRQEIQPLRLPLWDRWRTTVDLICSKNRTAHSHSHFNTYTNNTQQKCFYLKLLHTIKKISTLSSLLVSFEHGICIRYFSIHNHSEMEFCASKAACRTCIDSGLMKCVLQLLHTWTRTLKSFLNGPVKMIDVTWKAEQRWVAFDVIH